MPNMFSNTNSQGFGFGGGENNSSNHPQTSPTVNWQWPRTIPNYVRYTNHNSNNGQGIDTTPPGPVTDPDGTDGTDGTGTPKPEADYRKGMDQAAYDAALASYTPPALTANQPKQAPGAYRDPAEYAATMAAAGGGGGQRGIVAAQQDAMSNAARGDPWFVGQNYLNYDALPINYSNPTGYNFQSTMYQPAGTLTALGATGIPGAMYGQLADTSPAPGAPATLGNASYAGPDAQANMQTIGPSLVNILNYLMG